MLAETRVLTHWEQGGQVRILVSRQRGHHLVASLYLWDVARPDSNVSGVLPQHFQTGYLGISLPSPRRFSEMQSPRRIIAYHVKFPTCMVISPPRRWGDHHARLCSGVGKGRNRAAKMEPCTIKLLRRSVVKTAVTFANSPSATLIHAESLTHRR